MFVIFYVKLNTSNYFIFPYLYFCVYLAGILTKDLVMVQFKPELDLKAKDKRGEFIFVLDRSGQ